MMKIDLHCHSYYSHDGTSSPERLIKTALEKGLDGIALTDHKTTAGWEEAIKAAKKLKAVLILGQEIKTKLGDVLGLFLKKEVKSKELMAVIKEIKEQDGIVILPHPFYPLKSFKGDILKYKDLIDGIEIFNAKSILSLANKKAARFAQKYNLATIAGSDAHYYKNVGDAYTLAEEAKNLAEFKAAILKKQTKIEGKISSPLSLLFIPLAIIGFKEKQIS